jgi:hypothetical protein
MAIDDNKKIWSNDPAPVYLIPWDPESQEHVDRMKLQRIACGWKVEKVDSWRGPQSEGQLGLHWVVSDHAVPLVREESGENRAPNNNK